jgi:hypothetical protein
MMRIAFAVFTCVALAGAAAFADCSPNRPHSHSAKKQARLDPCVNLTGVPQISADVVAAEPAPAAKAPAYVPPTAAGYEGPTLGLSKPDPGVRPVPTVGYHWRLE